MKCLTCKHCEISFGTPDLSDVTPGNPGKWDCLAGQWESVNEIFCKDVIGRSFEIGEKCILWESDGRIKE